MTNRTFEALEKAADTADQEADLWRARHHREALDGETDAALKHAVKAAWCLDAAASIRGLRNTLMEGGNDG